MVYIFLLMKGVSSCNQFENWLDINASQNAVFWMDYPGRIASIYSSVLFKNSFLPLKKNQTIYLNAYSSIFVFFLPKRCLKNDKPSRSQAFLESEEQAVESLDECQQFNQIDAQVVAAGGKPKTQSVQQVNQ